MVVRRRRASSGVSGGAQRTHGGARGGGGCRCSPVWDPSRMSDPRWKLQYAINHRRVFTVGAPAEAARPGCCGG